MKPENKRNALRLLLEKLNIGEKTVSAKEIAKITLDGGSSFRNADPAELLNCLVEEKLVCQSGENTYSIIADIATLRAAILDYGDQSADKGNEQERAPMERTGLFDSEWTIAYPEEKEQGKSIFEELASLDGDDVDLDDDDDDDEDENDNEEDAEERRRQILLRMQAVKDRREDRRTVAEPPREDGIPFEVFALLQAAGAGVSLTGSDGDYFLVPCDLQINEQQVCFKIVIKDGEVFLSDDGFAIPTLEGKALFDEALDAPIAHILERYQIDCEDGELMVSVDMPKHVTSCMMLLYAAMELIITLDERNFTASAAPDEESDSVAPDKGEGTAPAQDRADPECKGSIVHANMYPSDPAYLKALAVVIKRGEVSISLVQRTCEIGYNHAGKIIEWMESMGYISPFHEMSKRRVLITRELFLKRYGPLD